ncbi:MAG: hypothetical protein H7301_09675 [Cryobacterium sp.]|nr:hypothetical protein [Oligoflexia bacterium]
MSASPLDQENWMPLMEYAMKTGVSLSTLRRYIKSGKVQYKSESGKYLILCKDPAETSFSQQLIDFDRDSSEPLGIQSTELEKLEGDLRKAQEEISELKMLVAIYEERLFENLSPQNSPIL